MFGLHKILKNQKNNLNVVYLLSVMFFNSTCTVIDEYDKIYLYDEDMLLTPYANEFYDIGFQSYREGSTANFGSRNGGGCGCY